MSTVSLQEAMQAALRHHQAGEWSQAEAIYRQMLAQQPRNPDVLHLLGLVAYQTGRLQEAGSLIGQAIEVNPLVPDYHNNLGEVYRALHQLDLAVTCYQKAILLTPNYPAALVNLGNAWRELSRLDRALGAFLKAAELRPDYAEAHYNQGVVLLEMGQADPAATAFRRAIQLKPEFAEAYNNLGAASERQGQLKEAVGAYQKAAALRADDPQAWNHLGDVLTRDGQLEEAISALREAIRIKPDYDDACNNLGIALRYDGRIDEARAACQQAIQLRPDFAEAHANLALLLLMRGEYAQGWAEYEWRWKCKEFLPAQRKLPGPLWDGSDPSSRKILVHGEQGRGDTIQFARYAPLLAKRGARIILECPPELAALMRSLDSVEMVVALGEGLPSHDCHVPLLSLPGIFGTTLETIPAQVPYLKPDKERVGSWGKKLGKGGVRRGRRVGLAWAGNPANRADRYRSVPPAALAPLAGVKGVRFFSLQKSKEGEQAKNPPPGLDLVDLTAEIKDFADTAALMANLDLIITVETAVAHLAGAMGRPVWTMIPFVPDWRWLLDREDSPWYPTMRLFRQTARGDWEGVAKRVAKELAGT